MEAVSPFHCQWCHVRIALAGRYVCSTCATKRHAEGPARPKQGALEAALAQLRAEGIEVTRERE